MKSSLPFSKAIFLGIFQGVWKVFMSCFLLNRARVVFFLNAMLPD